MVDLSAVERLFRHPQSVLERGELGAYKKCQPREAERIIDCYDVPAIVSDLVAELRELRDGVSGAVADIEEALA